MRVGLPDDIFGLGSGVTTFCDPKLRSVAKLGVLWERLYTSFCSNGKGELLAGWRTVNYGGGSGTNSARRREKTRFLLRRGDLTSGSANGQIHSRQNRHPLCGKYMLRYVPGQAGAVLKSLAAKQ